MTATIVREPGIQTTLGLDAPGVEADLTATYDVQGSYDWDNQRALGGPVFIAPNLDRILADDPDRHRGRRVSAAIQNGRIGVVEGALRVSPVRRAAQYSGLKPRPVWLPTCQGSWSPPRRS